MDRWMDGRTNAEGAGVQEHCSQLANAKKVQEVWGKRRRNKGVGRGAQKWGAWETRGKDCCGWEELEQVQNGRKLEASTHGER